MIIGYNNTYARTFTGMAAHASTHEQSRAFRVKSVKWHSSAVDANISGTAGRRGREKARAEGCISAISVRGLSPTTGTGAANEGRRPTFAGAHGTACGVLEPAAGAVEQKRGRKPGMGGDRSRSWGLTRGLEGVTGPSGSCKARRTLRTAGG
ncbi:hypothetical protein BD413DRAFT_579935 [Trametes elegans]|nr:hypothetical protein BD413DRAFT_579935 [Trametes elegans]